MNTCTTHLTNRNAILRKARADGEQRGLHVARELALDHMLDALLVGAFIRGEHG